MRLARRLAALERMLTSGAVTTRRRITITTRLAQTSCAIVLAALVAATVTVAHAQVAGGFGAGTTTPDAALHVFRDDKTIVPSGETVLRPKRIGDMATLEEGGWLLRGGGVAD